jgi:hypothetical protein
MNRTQDDAMIDSPTGQDAPLESSVRAIAFYLPQFHPIPENDEWWGRGFTEWTNVVRARPLFEGHEQPHLPTDLGFYDLRVPEVREAQADLARASGIHGFCYYYYSFGSKRLLERPLLEVVESGQPDFPFCICWANESWSRRWDGAEAQVLVAQDDSDATYRRFIHEVLPILSDRRYIRVDGAPVLLVWRVGRMPDATGTAASWREAALAAGLPGLYLCAVQSHDSDIDPRAHGFDAAVEFPPAPWHGDRIDPRTLAGLDPDFTGQVFDYRDLATRLVAREAPPYRLLRGVMTSWDNTPRRGPAAFLFRGSSPREYESWLRASTAWTEFHNPPAERLVFINAWNEWAEGAHLEPDQRHGRAWLDATARGLARASAWRGALEALRRGERPDDATLRCYLDDIEFALDRLERSGAPPRAHGTRLVSGWPPSFDRRAVSSDGMMQLEAVQGDKPRGRVSLRPGEPLHLKGWSFAPGVEALRAAPFLMLRSPNGERIFTAPIPGRSVRHDVSFRFRRMDGRVTALSGFEFRLDSSALTPGEYKLSVLHASEDRVVAANSEHRVVVQ